MTILQAFILGIVQGITEFLPISSSAHLVLIPHFFNWDLAEEFIFPFDVLVQVGTLLAVVIFFRDDLSEIIREFIKGLINKNPFSTQPSRMGWYIILASIPAGIAGLLLEDVVDRAFHNPASVGFFLLITACLLFLAERVGKKDRGIEDINWKDALWIGISQILALFPGISRSGSTITGGMIKNIKRSDAARFSFLMFVPIMSAAGTLSIYRLFEVQNLGEFIPFLIIGFFTSLIVGYISIRWLIKYLQSKPLTIFSLYCLLLGGFTLVYSYVS